MTMHNIAFLGPADALKTLIVLSGFISFMCEEHDLITLITEQNKGKCVDYCYRHEVPVHVLEDNLFSEEDIDYLNEKKFDLLISLGWDKLVPGRVLRLFPMRALNCHGSYLPDYRGSRAYMHYWANCEEYYGATIHFMNEKFDDGNIIVQGKLKLYEQEDLIMIHRRTAELISFLLPIAIERVASGDTGTPQKGTARYFYKITPETAVEYRNHNLLAIANGEPVKLTLHKEKIIG